jgi:hypothetical protein
MPLDAEMFLANAVRVVKLAAAEVWEPPPPVDFTQWATENVVFGNESPKPGAYDPDYHPWDRYFFEALQPDHPAREVVDVGSAQSGKTLRAQIFVGGASPRSRADDRLPPDRAQRDQLGAAEVAHLRAQHARAGEAVPDRQVARRRQQPALPGARRRPRPRRDRRRQLAGGLSQRSKPKQVQDDLSKWELNSAGDPEAQADNRSRAFAWAKNYKISTPLVNPGCRISRKYKLSTQGEFHLPCPHCGPWRRCCGTTSASRSRR